VIVSRLLYLLAAPGLLAGLGCVGTLGPDLVCTTESRPAVIVEIRDAGTGAPLAYDARGVVRDGAYADSLRPAMSSTSDPRTLYSRAAAHERAGTYAIEVVHPDYATWTTTGVRVAMGSCHVKTVTVQAKLSPSV
jgi:hypothetical protein